MEDSFADLLVPAAEMRCGGCAAALRPGAPWCTLCYADLRPAEPASEPAIETATQPAPLARQRSTRWPCTACGAENPFSVSACAACGAGFLAGLRESEGPLLELPGVGDLSRLSRGQRLALAAGVALVISTLTAILSLISS